MREVATNADTLLENLESRSYRTSLHEVKADVAVHEVADRLHGRGSSEL